VDNGTVTNGVTEVSVVKQASGARNVDVVQGWRLVIRSKLGICNEAVWRMN
jgi:hypothetical protein